MTRQEFAHQIAQYKLQSTRRLPNAYQEVEYLRGTGTQYINTGVVYDVDDFEVRGKAAYIASEQITTWPSIFGAYENGNRILDTFATKENGNRSFAHLHGNLASITLSYASMFSFSHRVKNGVETVQVNDEVARTFSYTYQSASTPFAIFSLSPTLNFFVGNVYGIEIFRQGLKIRDFVPCYRVSDNVAGLYDLVNGVFYTNMGTGTFAVGPGVGKGSIKFDGGIKCYLPSVKFYGACAQDGTPTPESPVPVKCNNSKWTMNGGGGTVDLSLLPDGGLYGIGNVRDEWDAATGKGIRRCGKISSYAGETVGDNWISSTGALTTGATVVYELSEPVSFTASPQPIIEQNGYNQLSQTDGDIGDTEAEATFVVHS